MTFYWLFINTHSGLSEPKACKYGKSMYGYVYAGVKELQIKTAKSVCIHAAPPTCCSLSASRSVAMETRCHVAALQLWLRCSRRRLPGSGLLFGRGGTECILTQHKCAHPSALKWGVRFLIGVRAKRRMRGVAREITSGCNAGGRCDAHAISRASF